MSPEATYLLCKINLASTERTSYGEMLCPSIYWPLMSLMSCFIPSVNRCKVYIRLFKSCVPFYKPVVNVAVLNVASEYKAYKIAVKLWRNVVHIPTVNVNLMPCFNPTPPHPRDTPFGRVGPRTPAKISRQKFFWGWPQVKIRGGIPPSHPGSQAGSRPDRRDPAQIGGIPPIPPGDFTGSHLGSRLGSRLVGGISLSHPGSHPGSRLVGGISLSHPGSRLVGGISLSHPGSHLGSRLVGGISLSHPGSHLGSRLVGGISLSHPGSHLGSRLVGGISLSHPGSRLRSHLVGGISLSHLGLYGIFLAQESSSFFQLFILSEAGNFQKVTFFYKFPVSFYSFHFCQ